MFFKHEPLIVVLCLFVVLGYAAIVASWGPLGWGLSWGMRLMTPTLPVLGFLIAPVLESVWRNKWMASGTIALALAGFALQILALLRDPTHVLIDRVQSGEVKFEDTIYSARNSWPALQIRMLPHWQPCDLDSQTLRWLLTKCPE
jgi:hypothetical protein